VAIKFDLGGNCPIATLLATPLHNTELKAQ